MYKKFAKTLLTCCLFACMWFGLPGVATAIDPSGVAFSPREGTYGGAELVNAKDAEFVFEGLTNFPGTQGYVQIQVLDYGDLESDQSRGAPWRNKITVSPDNEPLDHLGDNGAPRYQWKIGPLKLFEPFPTFIFPFPGTVKHPWRNQSTARVRFIAVATDSGGKPVASRFMATFDKDGISTGVPFDDGQMVLAHFSEGSGLAGLDVIPRYTFLDGLNKFRNKDSTQLMGDPKEETKRYYSAVNIEDGQMGGVTTNITNGLPDLEKFTKKYFDGVSETCRNRSHSDLSIFLLEDLLDPNDASLYRILANFVPQGEAQATYFNYGDLGLGRDMHCMRNFCRNETACYVANFGTIDMDNKGAAYFDDQVKAKEALDKKRPFAVVAMVERGNMDKDALNQTFFVVYSTYAESDTEHTNPGLGYDAKLDFTQHNTFIPGNCLSCHGIGSSYTSSDHKNGKGEFGVMSARFLPFDLSAFRYFSDDPTNPLSRAAQDGQFFALNLMIAKTSLVGHRAPVDGSFVLDNPEVKELIKGWYTPAGQPGLFNDEFVPPAWSDSEIHRQLYRKAVATVCRSCHISHSTRTDLRFGSPRFWFEPQNGKAPIADRVCNEHSMPNAEQSTRNLWRNEGRPALLDRSGIKVMGCPRESLAVAALIDFFGSSTDRPSSEARQSAVPGPTETLLEVSRAYRDEKCACITRDCNEAVEDKFVTKFVAADHSLQSEQQEASRLQIEALQCGAKVLESQ